MHITEGFLREAIETVRGVMNFDTGTYSDSDIMKMHGPTVSALLQAKTAIWIHESELARSAAP